MYAYAYSTAVLFSSMLVWLHRKTYHQVGIPSGVNHVGKFKSLSFCVNQFQVYPHPYVHTSIVCVCGGGNVVTRAAFLTSQWTFLVYDVFPFV